MAGYFCKGIGDLPMEIKVLGTRGNIRLSASGHKLHSGILIDGRIMLDIGQSEYLNCQPEYVFITHLHPDHAFFIEDRKAAPGMPVYAPEVRKGSLDMKVISGPVAIDDYLISPLPVAHSLNVKSVGYIVKKSGKSLFYTGDVAAFDGGLLDEFGRMDAIITEASFDRTGGFVRYKKGQPFGHCGVPDLVEMFAPHTGRIIFTHFGSWFIKDVEKGTAKLKAFATDQLKIEVANDEDCFLI
jgi:ribonuclease BN (tRNA processing enzyme)